MWKVKLSKQPLGIIAILLPLCHAADVYAENSPAIITDSITGTPLPGASVFDRSGRLVGYSRRNGAMPWLSSSDYPVTVRYMGYFEKVVKEETESNILMTERPLALPEVVVESRNHKLLHILAYVREYSTLSTYTDTVFLFREKTVDYMLVPDGSVRFKGWTLPRVLASRSYYRFTNDRGLDSVSDRCNQHFSWADWVGILPESVMPQPLLVEDEATDTVRGRYSATEMWHRRGDRVSLEVDVLADTTSRKWVRDLSVFFRKGIDFERFRVKFDYGDVVGDRILPVDLAGYSFNIESNGRGHDMFMFNRKDQPFYVSTYGEVYVVDKEYITKKEASKWENMGRNTGLIGIYESPEAPMLQPAVADLIARVDNVDHNEIRLGLAPDRKLVGLPLVRLNFGQQALKRIKGLLGIDHINGRRKRNKEWRDFRRDQYRRNATSK